jgi:hypothetical protein
VSNPASYDPDTGRVLAILRGAQRQPNDPDLDLAIMIAELPDTNDSQAYDTALERLIRDANPDQN